MTAAHTLSRSKSKSNVDHVTLGVSKGFPETLYGFKGISDLRYFHFRTLSLDINFACLPSVPLQGSPAHSHSMHALEALSSTPSVAAPTVPCSPVQGDAVIYKTALVVIAGQEDRRPAPSTEPYTPKP